jgi:hypothetical protein
VCVIASPRSVRAPAQFASARRAELERETAVRKRTKEWNEVVACLVR